VTQRDDPLDLAREAERTEHTPTLKISTIDDDEEVLRAIAAVIERDEDLRLRGEEVADFVRLLHPMLTNQESDLLDRILGLSEVREETARLLLIRWAFGEGQLARGGGAR
jgi:hypothetical protein